MVLLLLVVLLLLLLLVLVLWYGSRGWLPRAPSAAAASVPLQSAIWGGRGRHLRANGGRHGILENVFVDLLELLEFGLHYYVQENMQTTCERFKVICCLAATAADAATASALLGTTGLPLAKLKELLVTLDVSQVSPAPALSRPSLPPLPLTTTESPLSPAAADAAIPPPPPPTPWPLLGDMLFMLRRAAPSL